MSDVDNYGFETWVAVDLDGQECIYDYECPIRGEGEEEGTFTSLNDHNYMCLPNGSIKKLLGHSLTFKDDPVLLNRDNKG